MVEREEEVDFRSNADLMKVALPALSPPTIAIVTRGRFDSSLTLVRWDLAGAFVVPSSSSSAIAGFPGLLFAGSVDDVGKSLYRPPAGAEIVRLWRDGR